MTIPIRSISPLAGERGALATPLMAPRPQAGLSGLAPNPSMGMGVRHGVVGNPIDARRRRRVILTTLAIGAFVSFIAAIYTGGLALVVHLLVDIMLLGYAMLLVQYQRTRSRRLTPSNMDGQVAEPLSYISGGHR